MLIRLTRFPDTLEEEVEYQFVCFIHSRYSEPEFDNDTLNFEAIAQPSSDSVYVEMMDLHGQGVTGLRYVSRPGDESSELSISLDSDSMLYSSYFLQFWVKANALSNWQNFLPLSTGNVWKHTGTSPIWATTRQEITESWEESDTTFFKLARARQYSEGYGEGIVFDTLTIFEIDSDPYSYYELSGDNFASFAPPRHNDPWLYEGLFPQSDGSVMWGYQFMGGASLWEYGVGYALGSADGYGIISWLLGYRVNGVTFGDIETLVSIENEPEQIIPESISLRAFPNPFNGSVNFDLRVPKEFEGVLRIIDLNGQEVHLHQIEMGFELGQRVTWNPSKNLPSGVYFVQVEGSNMSNIERILLLK